MSGLRMEWSAAGRWWRSFVLTASAIASSTAFAAAPTLTYVFPPGGQRGTTVTVKCHGKFDWPVSVSAAGVTAAPGKEAGQLDITIPADVATDRVWIRLHNAEGASAAAPFLIGSLKEANEQEPNNSPKKAQAISDAAVTINGVLEDAGVDGFAVDLQAGQTLVAALDANTRLGTTMDGILQLATGDGFVLAENHDEVGLDPRLVYTAPMSGTVIVRVFAFPSAPNSSIKFYGGDAIIYRLTLTTGPFISHTVPLSAPLSEPGEVEVFGWNIPPGTMLPVTPLLGEKDGGLAELDPQGESRLAPDVRLGFVFSPEYAGSPRIRLVPYASASIVASDAAVHALPVPGAVTGRLLKARQTDRYQLTLSKGQTLMVLAEGRELDFPVEPVLTLKDPVGGVAATVDEPSPKKGSILNHTAAQDGVYELTIRDRYRTGSERSFYQLTARLDEPDFELTMSDESLVVTHDKPAELTVSVQRRGSGVGPITIQAVELPEGVTAAEVVSEAKGDKAAKVKFTFASTGVAFSGPVRIAGVAKEPQEIRRLARTSSRAGACFETLWLTVVAKPAEEKPADAPKAEATETK